MQVERLCWPSTWPHRLLASRQYWPSACRHPPCSSCRWHSQLQAMASHTHVGDLLFRRQLSPVLEVHLQAMQSNLRESSNTRFRCSVSTSYCYCITAAPLVALDRPSVYCPHIVPCPIKSDSASPLQATVHGSIAVGGCTHCVINKVQQMCDSCYPWCKFTARLIRYIHAWLPARQPNVDDT